MPVFALPFVLLEFLPALALVLVLVLDLVLVAYYYHGRRGRDEKGRERR
jgi:hypothetical protein